MLQRNIETRSTSIELFLMNIIIKHIRGREQYVNKSFALFNLQSILRGFKRILCIRNHDNIHSCCCVVWNNASVSLLCCVTVYIIMIIIIYCHVYYLRNNLFRSGPLFNNQLCVYNVKKRSANTSATTHRNYVGVSQILT